MDWKECWNFLQEVSIMSTPVQLCADKNGLFFQAEKDNK